MSRLRYPLTRDIKGTEKKWFNKQKNTVNFIMIKAGSRSRPEQTN
jgi:hypothetical protein